MKKILVTKITLLSLFLVGFTGVTFGQPPNDADPAVLSMSFATTPVSTGATNSTTTLTVSFKNTGFTTALAAGSVSLNISLPTTAFNPANGQFGPEYKAFPEDATNPTGTYASKFNWYYDAPTRNFYGTLNATVPPGQGGTIIITVKGYVPSAGPVLSIAHVLRDDPSFYPNEDVNNNNLTAGLRVIQGVVSVGLLDFNATGKDNRTVSTDWQTTSELNSNYFDVEFSTDGVKFSSIGTVTAAGNSSTPRSYNLIHTKPINGINYYRLKQVDQDGSVKYSVIRKVKFGAETQIYVMPNPTHDQIKIVSGKGGKVESVSIYTAEGRKMQQINNYTYGSSIDMSRFAPATYMIRITDKDGATEILKVIKN